MISGKRQIKNETPSIHSRFLFALLVIALLTLEFHWKFKNEYWKWEKSIWNDMWGSIFPCLLLTWQWFGIWICLESALEMKKEIKSFPGTFLDYYLYLWLFDMLLTLFIFLNFKILFLSTSNNKLQIYSMKKVPLLARNKFLGNFRQNFKIKLPDFCIKDQEIH